eukprot:Selendium_serpulae@DN6967_c0_g1_i1.p1
MLVCLPVPFYELPVQNGHAWKRTASAVCQSEVKIHSLVHNVVINGAFLTGSNLVGCHSTSTHRLRTNFERAVLQATRRLTENNAWSDESSRDYSLLVQANVRNSKSLASGCNVVRFDSTVFK